MYEGAVQALIDELGRLPGVGPKSAQRIAFYMLNAEAEEMQRLTDAISRVKTSVSFCRECGNVSETDLCAICRDESRDPSVICVVEESKDVVAIERTRSFAGRYHVLGGAINPLAGMGPEQLRIRELLTRLSDERITELILAMDPNLEGEATATYLSRMLVPLGIRLSRLASGLPVGGDLEYADEITLGRALEGRRIISEGVPQTNTAEQDFREQAQREREEAEHAAQAPAEPKKRWSGSMFDELDSSVASDSAVSDGAISAPEQQSSLDAALIEQALEDSAASGAGDSVEVAMETAADTGAETGAEIDKEEQIPVETAAAARIADYEQRLQQLAQEPLRTPKPHVPPRPESSYVNPWE
ncbi:MAG: recombination mediator RecR [Rothia sp. (in: high G+C Gram-positive bacteria)]|uniref:recombination mediator RecR n=1 Tax=Rothia sp. (in: high G+C Gram-positive bacteria) TaxID=1885016 RepID=UPI0026DED9B3|nr:recombination mediator RecR [Rothia sp. (in: high G+C Gram-positive bacteria)]MDO5750545.1 recombination mediator RecR [Rothia sp. (in: high G+C Gram-positive bacteria)]